jgi:hypothetical protein
LLSKVNKYLKTIEQNDYQLNITWEIPACDEDLEETVGLITRLLELDITILR